MNKIYFTADLHFGHTNILKHQPNRLFAGENDSTKHDEWLLELWRNTVGKKDMIYILGDLTFLKSEGARLLLEKLPGRKYMVVGNHDGSIKAYRQYFMRFEDIIDLTVAHALSGNSRKRNVDDVSLSDGDMESQTLRLHHASWSLPWKAR